VFGIEPPQLEAQGPVPCAELVPRSPAVSIPELLDYQMSVELNAEKCLIFNQSLNTSVPRFPHRKCGSWGVLAFDFSVCMSR
jgi:hypothetical protein